MSITESIQLQSRMYYTNSQNLTNNNMNEVQFVYKTLLLTSFKKKHSSKIYTMVLRKIIHNTNVFVRSNCMPV